MQKSDKVGMNNIEEWKKYGGETKAGKKNAFTSMLEFHAKKNLDYRRNMFVFSSKLQSDILNFYRLTFQIIRTLSYQLLDFLSPWGKDVVLPIEVLVYLFPCGNDISHPYRGLLCIYWMMRMRRTKTFTDLAETLST